MKFIQIYIILLFAFNFTQGQTDDKNYFKKNNICEVKIAVVFGDNKEKETEKFSIKKYDKNGNNIESTTYSGNKLKNKFLFKFDEYDNKILTIENGKKDLSNEYKYSYENKKINVVSNKSFEDKYFYDSINRLSKIVHFNKEDKEVKKILFKYDDRDNKIAEYVEDKPFHINQFLKYNEENLLVEEENYYHINDENKLYSKFMYEYDNNKKLILKKFLGGYATEPNEKYSYYENGKLKNVEIENSSITSYFYDKDLILKIEEIKIPLKFKITEYYEYKICE